MERFFRIFRDMRKGVKVRFKVYKKVAKEIFPNTLIIPDKSHLVAEVNSALDKVQKRSRRREKRELVETVDEEKRIWFLLMKSKENLRRREIGYGKF
uniref:Transposase IS204/IS1001/IS1096/IS1165 DDE domain-containing protein n=1 Tax=candidate division WOR-3 bacterium TaxID=2052148 RepID=A0A7C3UR54_UNCW3